MSVGIELPPLQQKMEVDTDSYLKNLDEVEKQTGSALKTLKSNFNDMSALGGKFQSFGAKMSLGVTTPLSLLGKQAYDTYKSFDTAFRGVTKTIDMTAQETDEMEKSIRNMAKRLPHSVEKIAEVAQAAGQLGIQKENILSFTETMLNLGVSTNLSAEEAATAIARLANVTGMSQKDFERFGSTVVALGNNFATTESEIVMMATRLAGAGKQAGMTESDIAALATTMSSLGIEAEMGGSAMSKLLNEIGVEIATNGENLQKFARISNMTTDEFKKSWENNAIKTLAAFTDGLGKSSERGEDMNVVLGELGFTEIRMTDAIRRMASAQGLLNETVDLGSKAWKENTALAKEAKNFNESAASQQTISMNNVRDALIDLGEALAPTIMSMINVVRDVANWFNSLDEGTQKLIVTFGLFAAAIGPVAGGIGTLLKIGSGLGGIFVNVAGGAVKAATSLAGVTASAGATSTAVAGATAATGGLLSSLGSFAVAAAPWALGAAAIAGGALLIHNELTKEAIPAVDMFADHVKVTATQVQDSYGMMQTTYETTTTKISEETQKQLGSYLELSESVQLEVSKMYAGVTQITDENISQLAAKSNELTTQITDANNQRRDNEIAILSELFASDKEMTEQHKSEILGILSQRYTEQNTKLEELQAQEIAIYEQIKTQTTGITQEQANELKRIQQEKDSFAISAMTENEAEKEAILQRYGAYEERVTAENAQKIIRALNKQRDDSVAIAEEEYAERVAVAERIRAQGGENANKTADEIIAAAKRQKEESIEQYEGMRADGINKLSQSYTDLYRDINIENGNIKSGMDKMVDDWNGDFDKVTKRIKEAAEEYNAQKFEDKHSTVTTEYVTSYRTIGAPAKTASSMFSHYNGLDAVPYDGYTARLHKGERILTAREAQNIDKSNTTNITIENVVNNREQDIRQLAEEIDFYLKQKRFG